MLDNLITYVRDFCEENPNFVLCREDQLIITLIKLRHNLTFELLAHIGKCTADDYFWEWIDTFLSAILGKSGRQSTNISDNTTGF